MKISRILQMALIVNFLFGASVMLADDEKPAAATEEQAASSDQEALFKKFEETLSGSKLVGSFTVIGKEGPLREEEYSITKISKLPKGDYWLFTARIKYGDHDLTVPLPLEVKWSGDTPVITLTDFTIPALGTFTSRVLIYNDKYAGTWTHGKVGGHLFGKIVKLDDKDADEVGEAK
ncbi:MAG: hypothetical protein RIC55_35875 [Pirellulaceae bacterium]